MELTCANLEKASNDLNDIYFSIDAEEFYDLLCDDSGLSLRSVCHGQLL